MKKRTKINRKYYKKQKEKCYNSCTKNERFINKIYNMKASFSYCSSCFSFSLTETIIMIRIFNIAKWNYNRLERLTLQRINRQPLWPSTRRRTTTKHLKIKITQITAQIWLIIEHKLLYKCNMTGRINLCKIVNNQSHDVPGKIFLIF